MELSLCVPGGTTQETRNIVAGFFCLSVFFLENSVPGSPRNFGAGGTTSKHPLFLAAFFVYRCFLENGTLRKAIRSQD